jgi:hypothetical protein
MTRKILAAALVLASMSAAPAFAAPYIGVAVGVSQADVDCGSDDCDKTGTAVKVLGGYEFTNNLAAEVTYYSLGKAVVHDMVDVDFKGAWWGLGGAWRPQFGNGWGGVARAGVAFTTGKVEASPVSFSHDSTQPYFGIGATYELQKNVRLEFDFDSTQITHAVGDVSTTSTVNAVVFGVTYGF